MMRFFNCPCGKNEENKPLLSPDDSSLQDKRDKGKAPEVMIQMPQTDEKAQQNPGTTQTYTQMFFKYCGKTLIGTGFTSTGLLVCADGVSTGLENHNPQHPNIEHAASLITWISCAVAPTAFILGALALTYANKLKGLTAQEAQPPAEEVDKSQQETSSSKKDQFFELSRPI